MSAPAALVTGAGRGIGKAIALSLAAEGFNVALNGPFDDAELRDAVEEVRASGVTAAACPGDVADLARHEGILDAAETGVGPLTTLVNNAGVSVLSRGDILDVSVESYDRCQAVNTRALFFLSQAFARRLLARQRDPALHYAIVNITSANVAAAAVNRAEYCVSKAGAGMATTCFAVRLGAENINVYEIQPGVIETDMTAPSMADYNARIADGLTLTRRVGKPDDVSAAVAMLATGKLAYSTGQAIQVDGGLLVPRF
jgi:NAD(P)-dependent dehydrogenase (short-subunit alcohol dehydrogenase family)